MRPVTIQDVSLFLAKNKRKRRGSKPKRVTVRSSDEALAEEMLSNFTLERLYGALSKHKVTIDWFVSQLMELYHAETTRTSEALMILDRLQELLLMGAIQDTSLAKDLDKRLSLSPKKGSDVAPRRSDPFTGKGLKLRKDSA